jgi:hypothetical protein
MELDDLVGEADYSFDRAYSKLPSSDRDKLKREHLFHVEEMMRELSVFQHKFGQLERDVSKIDRRYLPQTYTKFLDYLIAFKKEMFNILSEGYNTLKDNGIDFEPKQSWEMKIKNEPDFLHESLGLSIKKTLRKGG